MQEIIIKNVKTAAYNDINLSNIFGVQTEKLFDFKNSTVSSPLSTESKLWVTFYSLLPGKTNFPYHYHSGMEEVFYIIRGTGTLKTPDGDKTVSEGDVIVFPANEKGAHQLTNTSDDVLEYLDIDTFSSPEVVFYPDKGDFRIFTSTKLGNFPLDAEVNNLRNE